MRYLVTGGAGFIGSNIVLEGLKRNHDFIVLDNLSTGYRDNIKGQSVTFIQGDIRDLDLLREITKGVDGVFHLAASVGNLKSLEFPRQDQEINYGGTLNILEAMRENAVPLMVYSSTGAGYGEPVRLPVDEDHPFRPDSPYGISKIAAEKLCISYGKIYGFRAVCLRYFNAYGVNQRYDAYGNVIPIFATRLLNKQPLIVYGDGLQTRDFVNVRDIARANWIAAESSELSGYYNVATGQQTTINELIETICQVNGEKPSVEYQPFRPGEVIHSVADISKFASAANYHPEVSLKEGLEEYWNWFKHISG